MIRRLERAHEADTSDETELVFRASQGDDEAFRTLVDRHQRRAYAVAFGVVRNADDARDVVQEAFIKAHRNLGRFHGASRFYTWFYRIVMNVAIDWVRRQARKSEASYDDRVGREEEVEGAENILPHLLGANPARNVGRRELREQMDRALGELSPLHRSVLLLREIEGLSYKEIARAMRCSKGTVMSRLFHARRRMQRLLLGYLGGRDLRVFE